MKNPYRSIDQVPLRTVAAVCLLILVLAKLAPAYEYFFDPGIPPSRQHDLVLVSIGLILTCLLDVGAIYYLTIGWSALFDQPWFVLLSPLINLVLGVAGVVMFGPGNLLTELQAAQVGFVIVAAAGGVVAAALLTQLVSAVLLYGRIKSDRPLP